MLQTTTSRNGPSRDEVVQQQGIERVEHTPRTLNGLINHFGQRIGRIGIVASGAGVPDVVMCLETFEALGASIVDILSIANELRRRRSVGGRHFKWRTG